MPTAYLDFDHMNDNSASFQVFLNMFLKHKNEIYV